MDHANFLTEGVQIITSLSHGFGAGTHDNHHALCIRGTEILEQVVVATSQTAELLHRLFNDAWTALIKRVDCFSALEIDVWILSSSTNEWAVWIQGPSAMSDNELFVNHVPNR